MVRGLNLKFNTQAFAGMQTIAGTTFGQAGLRVGAVSQDAKGNYLKADVSATNKTVRGAIEAGHEFKVGKNLGLEVGANANYTLSHSSTKHTVSGPVEIKSNLSYYNNNGKQIDINAGYTTDKIGVSVKQDQMEAGLNTKLAWKPSWGEVKVGAEAGVMSSPRKNYEYQTPVTMNASIMDGKNPPIQQSQVYENNCNLKLGHTSFYARPTVDAQVNLNKNLAITGHADFDRAEAGFKWTF